jgi:hypothetical protein
MPKWLDTSGYPSIAIAICDRCKMKRPFSDLQSDFNFPGLRVCSHGCKDNLDPYRLAARKTERINLRFPRLDVSVATDPNELISGEYGGYVLSTEGNTNVVQNDGNLDGLQVTPPINIINEDNNG